jgi:bifunctional non-homologous end joining protein LigD
MKARRRARPRAKLLELYNRKRRFKVTSEPKGTLARRAGRSFVIQKHDASRLHYDFRLELDGVLKSWAVPKGPSLNPGDKRLAMQTEDHPVSYKDFEGVIPEGEYGAGPVIVWDRGTWQPLDDPHEGLDQGALKFALDGEKLKGQFSLVRLKRGEGEHGKPWLLIKRSDDQVRTGAAAEITAVRPESVLSGRTVEEVEQGKNRSRTRGLRSKPAARKGAKVQRRSAAANREAGAPRPSLTARLRGRGGKRLPAFGSFEPQLATLVDHAPSHGDYVYEIKYDGYRTLAYVEAGHARLATRTGLDWTDRFARVAEHLAALPARQAILDGEVCYVLDDGRTDFQHLQNALKAGRQAQARLVYFAFDLLFIDGEDLRDRPLAERKQRLRALLGEREDAVRFSADLSGEGRTVLAQACRLGLEGLIAKRSDRPYRPGRSGEWLKLKCHKRQEFVIVGMTAPGGSRQGFGALLLGLREGDRLRYAGKVGTGFSDRSLQELMAKLAPLAVDAPQVAGAPRLRAATWVRPELVCEVSYTEMTRDGSLRHPSFEGLREDKPAALVQLEQPVKAEAAAEAPAAAGRGAPSRKRGSAEEVGGVRITHPERVMDERSGVTKAELARYHDAVADLLMPYARNRPLALVRCPQGNAHECFFQKQATAGFSDAIRRDTIEKREVLYVREPRGIIELVQFNVMELHGWGAQVPDWDKPDWIVFDFDPDTGLPFGRVIDAALEMRELLTSLSLTSYVKTTGGKGLHVVVPLKARLGWEPIRAFTRGIAEETAKKQPKTYVATASKDKRKGRIFIDWLRNGIQATAVLPYSPRARPGATVAMPLAWSELKHVDPRELDVRTALRWIENRRRDPWADFFEKAQDISERLGVGTEN